METGHYLQIIISVVVIIGAAGIALFCDVLKNNNEKLREMNVELRVRREEEQRRAEQALQQTAAGAAPVSEAAETMALATLKAPAARISVEAGEAALDRGAAVASRRGSRRQEPVEEVTERAPGTSLEEARMLARQYMGRAAERARAERAEEPKPEIVEAPIPRRTRVAPKETPKPAPAPVEKAPAAVEPVSQPVAVAVAEVMVPRVAAKPQAAKKDWGTLLKVNASTAKRNPATIEVRAESVNGAKTGRGELISFDSWQGGHADPNETRLPEGFHGLGDVSRLLHSARPVRGLVIAVGINDLMDLRQKGDRLAVETLLASVGEHVRSMMRPGDFGCQSSEDEYVLISSERDAAAQRRLGEVAELLWDFQLRSVGTDTILFSWGGFEAKGEPMSDAVASAIERMQETRSSRRSMAIEAPRRRRAV